MIHDFGLHQGYSLRGSRWYATDGRTLHGLLKSARVSRRAVRAPASRLVSAPARPRILMHTPVGTTPVSLTTGIARRRRRRPFRKARPLGYSPVLGAPASIVLALTSAALPITITLTMFPLLAMRTQRRSRAAAVAAVTIPALARGPTLLVIVHPTPAKRLRLVT